MEARVRQTSHVQPTYHTHNFGINSLFCDKHYTYTKYYYSYGDRYVDFAYKDLSSITDYPISGSKGCYNNVYHVKRKPVDLGSKSFKWTFDANTPFLGTSVTVYASPSIPGHTWLDWNKCLESFANLVQTGTSQDAFLMPYLREAGQVIRMIRNPFGLLASNWRSIASKSTAARLALKSANVFLEAQFGWKPFFNDLTQTSKTIATVINKYGNQLEDQKCRCSTASYHSDEYLSGRYSHGDVFACSLAPSLLNRGELIYTVKEAIYSSVGYITGIFQDDVRRVSSKLDLLAKKLGVAPTWRNIRDCLWEVTPFSFVVDWFVDINKLWRPLTVRELSLATGLTNVGYSQKTSVSYVIEYTQCIPHLCYDRIASQDNAWYGKAGAITSAPGIQLSPRCEASLYTRTQGLPPDSSSFLRNKGLSTLQCAESAALIIQRLLHT